MYQSAGVFAIVLGALAGVISAFSSIKKAHRTVAPGCLGMVFRFKEPLLKRGVKTRDPAITDYRFVEPGEFKWGLIPGMDELRFTQEHERATADTSIACLSKSGKVLLVHAVLNYSLSRQGVKLALCRATGTTDPNETQTTGTFDFLVSSAYQVVVTRVIRRFEANGDPAVIQNALQQAVRTDPELRRLGVLLQAVMLTQISEAPSTQAAEATRYLADAVRATRPDDSQVGDALVAALNLGGS